MHARSIYLDNQATTPLDLRVKAKMLHYFETEFGNASSSDHFYGERAKVAVKKAKAHIADLVDAPINSVYFTSGTTESINLAIKGYVYKHYQGTPLKLVTLPVEHKAVLDTCKHLEKQKLIQLQFLNIGSDGHFDISELEKFAKEGLDFIVIMAANNEVGTLYPIKEVGQIAKQYGIPFFCDASQAVGKIPISFRDIGADFLAFTGHKMYGPKGCGALVMNKDIDIEPLIHGGGHQNGIRPGTLNVPGIVGLGEACRILSEEIETDHQKVLSLKNHLLDTLSQEISNLKINGDLERRLAGNLNISIPGIENHMMIAHIKPFLAISTGSACTSGLVQPSHVLQAMNLSDDRLDTALRISIGKFNTLEEINQAAELIITAYSKLYKLI